MGIQNKLAEDIDEVDVIIAGGISPEQRSVNLLDVANSTLQGVQLAVSLLAVLLNLTLICPSS